MGSWQNNCLLQTHVLLRTGKTQNTGHQLCFDQTFTKVQQSTKSAKSLSAISSKVLVFLLVSLLANPKTGYPQNHTGRSQDTRRVATSVLRAPRGRAPSPSCRSRREDAALGGVVKGHPVDFNAPQIGCWCPLNWQNRSMKNVPPQPKTKKTLSLGFLN